MNSLTKEVEQEKSPGEHITYILIDFENVQPSDFDLIKNRPIRVKLFLGANQSRIPVALAASLQSLGESVEYVMITAAGKNALDFHITFYAGLLLATDPAASLFIVSKDTGFDPLLKHLVMKGLSVRRVSSIDAILSHRAANEIQIEPASIIDAVIADLVRRKAAKPRTTKTLLSTIRALFKKELSEDQASELLAELCARGKIKINETKVSYSL